MGDVSIAVELREGRGKGFNRKLRVAGRVPAVVYGSGSEPVALSIDPINLDRQIKMGHAGMNTLFDLEGADQVAGRTVMVKELQREPVRGAIVHADFFVFDQTKRIHVTVPIHLKGDAPGVVMGGLVEHTLRELELACLPGVIPDELEADISALEVGMSIHVSELVLPTGVELISDGELSVVTLAAPREEEEVEAVAEGEEAAATEDGGDKAEEAGESKGD
jgi:large subunit ribosomal protein L25